MGDAPLGSCGGGVDGIFCVQSIKYRTPCSVPCLHRANKPTVVLSMSHTYVRQQYPGTLSRPPLGSTLKCIAAADNGVVLDCEAKDQQHHSPVCRCRTKITFSLSHIVKTCASLSSSSDGGTPYNSESSLSLWELASNQDTNFILGCLF